MKEIIKYHNDFNKIKLPSFTELEQNLLFRIISKVKESKDEYIFIKTKEIRKWVPKKDLSNYELYQKLKKLRNNFFKADFTIIRKTPIPEKNLVREEEITTNLFKIFWISAIRMLDESDYVTKENFSELEGITLQVNTEFAYLINELTANFTAFELEEFIALSGKYTKTLYRLLKQYRNTGYLKMEWDEFAMVMDIPEKLKQCDIDKDILKPAIKELTKERNLFDITRIPFENLTYTKLKGKGRGRGGNVIGIEFKFKKQTDFFTKNEQIEFLRKENAELTKEVMENNLAKLENSELKEQIDKLEKIAYGIGLKAYCGLKYYSEKNETLKVLDFNEVKNSSDSNRYVAEILNEKTNKSFFIYLESPKHLVNLISKNEKDLFFHNQELIKKR